MSAPEPRLIRTPRDAEELACDWLRHWGFSDARVTPVGADEGIDVYGESVVAQVKAEARPTSRPTMQSLGGVAAAEDKDGVFFALGGYTAEAMAWANRAGIALFTFDLSGAPEPVNEEARQLMTGAREPSATNTFGFSTRPQAEPLPGPWAQPLPSQDLHAEPLRPGDVADPQRLANTIVQLCLKEAKWIAGRHARLWTTSHRYLWTVRLDLQEDGSVDGELEVFYLCLPEWRHGRLPKPAPPKTTVWEVSVEPPSGPLYEFEAPADTAESIVRHEHDAEVTASGLALSRLYGGQPWEPIVVQVVADLSSIVRTLGHELTETHLEVRDTSAELQMVEAYNESLDRLVEKARREAGDYGEDDDLLIDEDEDGDFDCVVHLLSAPPWGLRAAAIKALVEEAGVTTPHAKSLLRATPSSIPEMSVEAAARLHARLKLAGTACEIEPGA